MVRISKAASPMANPLTADEFIAQLRTLAQSVPAYAQLSPDERRALRDTTRDPDEVLLAEFDLIDLSPAIERAVGRTTEEARGWLSERNRWETVESEIAALLAGVSGGNLVRRQQMQLLGIQAYTIAATLARGDGGRNLIPHVEEIRRLRKKATRRKRTPPAGGDE